MSKARPLLAHIRLFASNKQNFQLRLLLQSATCTGHRCHKNKIGSNQVGSDYDAQLCHTSHDEDSNPACGLARVPSNNQLIPFSLRRRAQTVSSCIIKPSAKQTAFYGTSVGACGASVGAEVVADVVGAGVGCSPPAAHTVPLQRLQ